MSDYTIRARQHRQKFNLPEGEKTHEDERPDEEAHGLFL
jgi:hypothetical protein